ncbi:MAG: hypothetical protein EOQ92_15540 [Mesorhizobium sp.]|nr:MAG: hypothetical protein EOQ92_15540 [Mesorhizobium sp.]RWK51410.1 MAG: hypothetical protein EOR47_06790 [Mesorhizobium sp.]RWK96281.1 MAG: hypothetical protein EOR53_10750 [Mesorhizobium sp.]TIP61007.1 MAG: hypothetical protein E5X56_03380 [Mesorhizobium sp.]TJW39231.1 MAG: hypothetical protein E5X59_30020 [Mesorhizobium sp.]
MIVKVPWTICTCLCLIIGMRRFMQSECVSLVELPRLHPGSYPADGGSQPLPRIQGCRFRPIAVAQSATLPISPLAGEMPGRAEGGAVPRPVSQLQPRHPAVFGREWIKSRVGDPSHPPLSCRTSPPQGGRLDAASAFANHQRWKTGQATGGVRHRLHHPFAIVDGHRANA